MKIEDGYSISILDDFFILKTLRVSSVTEYEYEYAYVE